MHKRFWTTLLITILIASTSSALEDRGTWVHTGDHDFEGALKKDGVAITATAAEINQLDGSPSVTDPAVLFSFYDEFLSIYTNDGASPVYALVQDEIGGTVGATKGGVMDIITGSTDNDEYTLQAGPKGTEGPFDMESASGETLNFKAQVASIHKFQSSMFVGMAEPGQGADFLQDNTGTNGDVDVVGFILTMQDTNYWSFVHQKAGAAIVIRDNVLTNTPGTAVTFGFDFDGKSGLVYTADSVALGTITNTSVVTFPDGEGMHLIFGSKTGSGIAASNSLYYWHCQQTK